MDTNMERKIEILKQLSKSDEKYRELYSKFLPLEKQFTKIVNRLTNDEQDVIWDFVFTSDELDQRLLEIACDYIHIR